MAIVLVPVVIVVLLLLLFGAGKAHIESGPRGVVADHYQDDDYRFDENGFTVDGSVEPYER